MRSPRTTDRGPWTGDRGRSPAIHHSPLTIRQRGFTLVEMMVVLGVASIVLLGLGLLYTTTMSQLGDAAGEMAATDQASTAFADMEFSVRNAVVCDMVTLNGVTALRCRLPSVGVDLNGDGVPESYAPATLDKFGLEHYALGTRVWYYLSDATGAFGTAGTILWRANVATDANPATGDRDLAWTLVNGVSPRFTLVTGFTPTIDATNDLVTLDLATESADYAVRQAAASDTAAHRRGIHLTAQAFWRHWRT